MLKFLLIGLIFCFIINIPIGYSMGIATAFAVLMAGTPAQLIVIPQRFIASMDSFPLLAVPLFMVAGAVMEYGGVSKRIVSFASSLIGHIRGGIGAVVVLSCAIFAAISGSTPATAAAIGAITIPEMKKRNYPMDYSSAVVASSACLGVIIPPSTVMVIVGVAGDISVGKLLIGGIIPGIILALFLIITNAIMAKKLNIPSEEKTSWKGRWHSFKDAIWALLMPVIILGGIMSGIFTPTESAAVAVVYGILVGFFVYKELTVKDIIPVFVKAALSSAMIMLLIGCSGAFGWIMTACNVQALVKQLLFSISTNPTVIYAIILALLLLMGCFMDTAAIVMLIIPILAPIVRELGFDMVAFGVIATIDLAIGMATPPVGVSLFATCGVSKVTMGQISSKVWPFLIALVIGLFLLMFFPQLCSWLPNMLIK